MGPCVRGVFFWVWICSGLESGRRPFSWSFFFPHRQLTQEILATRSAGKSRLETIIDF